MGGQFTLISYIIFFWRGDIYNIGPCKITDRLNGVWFSYHKNRVLLTHPTKILTKTHTQENQHITDINTYVKCLIFGLSMELSFCWPYKIV